MTKLTNQYTKTLLVTLCLLSGVVGIARDAWAAPPRRSAARTPNQAGNDCGEAPWNQIFSGVVNDGPNNALRPACQFHDRCYWGGTHGFPFMGNRKQCDDAWNRQMITACNQLSTTRIPAGRGWTSQRQACLVQANTYYSVVRNLAGFMWAGNPKDNN